MKGRQKGFTILEMVVVFAIIAIMLAALIPLASEPIRHARINGAVAQAKEIVTACNAARVAPASTSRNATNQKVTSTYGPVYTSWTDVSVLAAKLSAGYVIPSQNPFERPYYFKMTDKTCSVAVELDGLIDGWEGHETETAGGRTRIVVSTERRSTAGPAWVQRQKQLLTGESVR